ncbi:MAG: hypothetical protein IPN84_11845 [Sphingomonadales bacterium]|jgi:hypothetical protein|nr:hypothetical protein [Sphingomonadales bacterium]
MNLPRILPLLGAAALSFLTLAPTVQPVYAAQGPEYSAKLTSAIEGTRVASDTLWRCAGTECTASRATARATIVCAHAAREFGKLESFAFQGKAFDEAALAKCNAKAR